MPPTPDLSGPRRALVVATATYTDPDFARLRAPAQDAADMIDVLEDPAIGGFTATPVLDRSEYEIRRAIDKFLAEGGVDDVVVVYLSCHGVLDARGRLYFAATDTRKSLLSSTGVESAWLLDRLEECRARRQVLILDCCFSGAFARTKGGSDVELERRLGGSGRGRAVLTASRAGEYSYEGTPLLDTAPSRSVFTAALVDGLRTGRADRDGDGYVSVEDAYDYAAEQVAAQQGAQSPQRWLYGGEGAIVLARNPRGAIVTPAELPEALRLALSSPYPNIRTAAVSTLGTWLTSTDEGQVLAARQALQLVATQDSPAVATAARELLGPAASSTEQAPETKPAAPTVSPPSKRPVSHRPVVPAVPRTLVRTIKGHAVILFSQAVWSVAFSPNGRLLASGGNDNSVRLWDPDTGRQIGHPLTGHTSTVVSVAFSPDGRLLASASRDKTVRLWDPDTGRQIGLPLTSHTGWVVSVAFSRDGRLLASASSDKTVRLWDPDTGRQIGDPLAGHTNSVYAVAFSPDGRLLASASDDETVRLWDPDTGRQIGGPLTGHTGWVRSVAFSPNGRLLASASSDKTVRLWDPDTRQQIGHPLTGHTDSVYAVAFSPHGHLLASASFDKTVRMWDPDTGRQIGLPLTGHTGWVLSVAFSPDGRLLASASSNKTIRLWGSEP